MEYLIIRNQNQPRLFDVIKVHFERSVPTYGQIVKSAMDYNEAAELVDHLNNTEE